MHVRLRHRVSEDFAVTKRLQWVDFTLKCKSPVSGTVCLPKALPSFICDGRHIADVFMCLINQFFLLLILQNPETGKYEFRYIFVDMDVYPRRTIIVEDNR